MDTDKEKLWINPRKASLHLPEGNCFSLFCSLSKQRSYSTQQESWKSWICVLGENSTAAGQIEQLELHFDLLEIMIFLALLNQQLFIYFPQFTWFSIYSMYCPDCFNPPQPFFCLSKEIGKLKCKNKIFPGSMFWKENIRSGFIILQKQQ